MKVSEERILEDAAKTRRRETVPPNQLNKRNDSLLRENMKSRTLIRRAGTIGILYGIAIAITAGATSLDNAQDPRDTDWNLAIDPHKVVGAQSCEKCHANEINVWKQTPHSKTFLTLHRKKEAQQIASKLGIQSFKTDSNCIQCHYTMQDVDGTLEAIAGVSCESCHGGARDWMQLHNDYGPGATRDTETVAHRRQRLTTSIKAGMRNPVNVYLVAQSCYRCHTVPDEKLVNVGGHSAGSLDFELVSWSQGSVRHRFLDGNNTGSNDPAPIERQRLLFVAGMIADLEQSLRATSKATEKATFAITSAQRASRAAKRLEAAQAKINNDVVGQVLTVYKSVKLKVNNEQQLSEAADQVNKLGLKFAATTKAESLAAIDEYIPPKESWK